MGLFLQVIALIARLPRATGSTSVSANGHIRDTYYVIIKLYGIRVEPWQLYIIAIASGLVGLFLLYASVATIRSSRRLHE